MGPITLETFAGDLLAALSVAMLLTSRSQPCAPPGAIELAARVEEHTLRIREQIVGTWRLESICEKDTRGKEIDAGCRAIQTRSSK